MWNDCLFWLHFYTVYFYKTLISLNPSGNHALFYTVGRARNRPVTGRLKSNFLPLNLAYLEVISDFFGIYSCGEQILPFQHNHSEVFLNGGRIEEIRDTNPPTFPWEPGQFRNLA